jgi:transcriptional regulator with XRE-family HTH domain
VEFQRKIRKLTEGLNRAEIARRAGVKPTVLNNYINRGSEPMAKAAWRLAVALDVPADWLLDDEADFPPPARAAAAGATTEQLAAELGRRLGGVGAVMLAKLYRAEKIDWLAAARELLDASPDKPLPSRLRDAIELPGAINLLAAELLRFDPFTPLDDVPADVRDRVQAGYRLSLVELWQQANMLRIRAGYAQAAELAYLWSAPENLRPAWFAEVVAHIRSTVAEQLNDATAKAVEQAARERLMTDFNAAQFADEGEPADAVARKRREQNSSEKGNVSVALSNCGTRGKSPKKR